MSRAFAAALVVVAACGGGGNRVEGVVVGVEGDLDGVVSFEIVTAEGRRMEFVPAPGLDRFDHGGPLSHLSEHLQTGVPIGVDYVEEDGLLIAEFVSG